MGSSGINRHRRALPVIAAAIVKHKAADKVIDHLKVEFEDRFQDEDDVRDEMDQRSDVQAEALKDNSAETTLAPESSVAPVSSSLWTLGMVLIMLAVSK